MGLFSGESEKKKRTKPFFIIKILIKVAMMYMLVMGFISENTDFFFGWLFVLLGVNAIIDGIESYFQKEDKRVYLLNFGFGVIFLILALQFL